MSGVSEQIDLPPGVALGIVLQGLRIRLGRSLVTITGVILGIAMLSSTATTYLVKNGVREEDRVRGDVRRMLNFLAAELGTIEDKTIGVIYADHTSEAESRFIAQTAQTAGRIIIPKERDGSLSPSLPQNRTTPQGDISSADAIVVVGSIETSHQSLSRLAASQFTKPVAMTRLTREDATHSELYLVPLSTELTDVDKVVAEREKRTERFRVLWILGVALLVTVMGITNAMLMSVTERFREIGTMKCLGATSRLVRRIFMIESLIIGISDDICGALLGAASSLVFYAVAYGPSLLFQSMHFGLLLLALIAAVFAGILLTVMSAIYPASVASSMVPAAVLRSNV